MLLKVDEGHSRDSEPDDEEEEESSDEEDEDATKYINASYIQVCHFTFILITYTKLTKILV